ALLNIMGNAMDAVEDRKQPQVQATVKPDPDAGWVRIEILDNGIGISPEKVEDIFKPFVSTKGSKGTGLGLPVSRKILREHGGDIIVKSEAGKGSKFILRMPIKSPLGVEGGPPLDMTMPIPPETPDDTVAS